VLWQKKRETPWKVEQFYPAGKDGKTLMTINWLLNDTPLTAEEELGSSRPHTLVA
jgi:hypothetical protein